jgi:tetratricopeptide (TPR) repeat protein
LLLLFLIALAQNPPHYWHYLSIAGAYGSGSRDTALREIRQWRPHHINAAVNDLRQRGKDLRPSVSAPDEIAFDTVEAAILMHLEAGLLALQTLRLDEADVHFRASTTLFEWSRVAAVEARNLAEMRRFAFEKHFKPDKPEPQIRERIDRRDYYLALAAGALANGIPPTALPFAEKARVAAPLDPEVQLVFGCVAESLAHVDELRRRDSETARRRDEAERALREVVALDPEAHEARLHLGRLLLLRSRHEEAEAILEQVEQRSGDDRQRYLARLFLGRVAEQRGHGDEAASLYRRALEAWPDSQAARLALSHALEVASGPAEARPLVAASLAASQQPARAGDPWWLYLFGPPGVAKATLDRLLKTGLDQ